MKQERIKDLFSDWRVLVLIVLLVLSVIAIYPHFDSNGNLTTNLQYGLDFQQGSWIQLEFKAEVVGFTTTEPVDTFVANLSKSLDTDVVQVDANHLEIRKSYTQAELQPYFAAEDGTVVSYQPGISATTADLVKQILVDKINSMGTKDAKVNTITGLNGVTQYVRVEMAGVDMNQAQQIVGKQGKFEIRIQTTGNQTEHVLYGDSITSVAVPSQSPAGSGNWGVGFTLSSDGAATFQNAAITYGATTTRPTTDSPCCSTTRACTQRRCPRHWQDRSRANPQPSCSPPPDQGHPVSSRQQTLRSSSGQVRCRWTWILQGRVRHRHPLASTTWRCA